MAWKSLVALMTSASIYMISSVSSESYGFVELLFNRESTLVILTLMSIMIFTV